MRTRRQAIRPFRQILQDKPDTSAGSFASLLLHPHDPDLAALAAIWPKMSEHIRAAIMGLAVHTREWSGQRRYAFESLLDITRALAQR